MDIEEFGKWLEEQDPDMEIGQIYKDGDSCPPQRWYNSTHDDKIAVGSYHYYSSDYQMMNNLPEKAIRFVGMVDDTEKKWETMTIREILQIFKEA